MSIVRYLVNVVQESGVRMHPQARRELVLVAATEVFGARGYHGATTHGIARAAGISQPYVVRMFGSKQALFVEVVEHCLAALTDCFRTALAGVATEQGSAAQVFDALGDAYVELARTRGVHLSLMQCFLLGADPVIGPAAREGFLQIWGFLRHEAGLDAEQAHRFAAGGMLINTVLGLGMDTDAHTPGARELVARARLGGAGPAEEPSA